MTTLSLTCAATHIPIAGAAFFGQCDYTHATLILPGGDRLAGFYDGCGNLVMENGRRADILMAMLPAPKQRCRMVLTRFLDRFDESNPFSISHADPCRAAHYPTGALGRWHAREGFVSFGDFLDDLRFLRRSPSVAAMPLPVAGAQGVPTVFADEVRHATRARLSA